MGISYSPARVTPCSYKDKPEGERYTDIKFVSRKG